MERTPEEQEMLDLRLQVQGWIDNLIVAGMAENAALSAIHLALVERALVLGGVGLTLDWLRNMAALVEHNGSALLRGLKEQGH